MLAALVGVKTFADLAAGAIDDDRPDPADSGSPERDRAAPAPTSREANAGRPQSSPLLILRTASARNFRGRRRRGRPPCSPMPTQRIGSPSSRATATTIPPLAVPSNLARTKPVTPTPGGKPAGLLQPRSGPSRHREPVKPDAAPGGRDPPRRALHLLQSAISRPCCAALPAVSTMTVSTPRAFAACKPSNNTALGSAPAFCRITGQPVRPPQTDNCSAAAARKVSPAQSRTLRPSWVSRWASLPIVVVLPTPVDADDQDHFGRLRPRFPPAVRNPAKSPSCGRRSAL